MQTDKFAAWEEYQRGGAADSEMLDSSFNDTMEVSNARNTSTGVPSIVKLYHTTSYEQPEDKQKNPQFLQFKFIRRPPPIEEREQCIPMQISLQELLKDQKLIQPT
jgi:hypothetical protein